MTIPASKGPEDGFAFRTLVRHDDPIVRDHRVYSSRIMPGVTFIDLFQRAARACGHPDGTMELRNVVFPQALSVREGDEREIEVRVSRALGHWEVQARSRLSGPGARPAGEAWETNALAQLHEVPKWEEPRFDVERHIQAASGVADFGRLYEQLRLNGILHLEFMKVQGRVHLGPEGALAELELSPSASRHADHFALHPAFLDAATATSFFAGYADKRFGGQVFIPMFLERFRAFDRLGRKCFVHVRGQHEREPEGADLGKDALISLLSPDGALLARFDTLAFKRVRSRDAIVARTAAADAHRPVQPKATSPGWRPPAAAAGLAAASAAFIAAELSAMVSDILKAAPGSIDVSAGFYDLGLESTDLLTMAGRLERRIGTILYPTLLFEYPNIRDLAEHLHKVHAAAFSSLDPAAVRSPAPGPREKAEEAAEGIPHLFRFGWKESRAAPGGTPAPADTTGAWLVFDRGGDFFTDFETATRAEGKNRIELIAVSPGERFEQRAQRRFVVRPGVAEDYALLLRGCEAAGLRVAGAFHFWNLALPPLSRDVVRGQLDLGLWSAACLGRALVLQGRRDPVSLVFFHSDSAEPAIGAIAGFAESLRKEAPDLTFRVVGHSGATDGASAARLAWQEISIPGKSVSVRYDSGRRLERTAFPLDHDPRFPANHRGLREGGVYLLTGGAGGLGLSLARHLCGRHAARVVLVGRSELSPGQKATIRQLPGGEERALYLRADVADIGQMAAVVAASRDRFGPLDGVFHAAGILDDSLVRNFSRDAAEKVLSPKIEGTLVLDEVTRSEPLAFFALFSSLGGVLGNPGQAVYGAGNRFMDEFAEWRALQVRSGQRRGHALSIDWPLWADGGMTASVAAVRRWTEATGIIPLTAEAGWAALESVLAADVTSCAVVPGARERVFATLAAADEPKPHQAAPAERGRPEGDDTIAIVGVSGRYPKARDIEQFRSNLSLGLDCISEVPDSRWDHGSLFDPDRTMQGKCYARWGGFLDDVDRFDPLFFNISPRDAELMDPQERLFLETSWSALEDAGYCRSSLGSPQGDRSVGVFVGVMWGGYQLFGAEEFSKGRVVAANSSYWTIANRVSHYFDLSGPSFAVDSACSSSMTALHLACESLRKSECRMAIAGGVNLSLHPTKYLLLSQLGMLSSHGRCKSFGADADGYTPGEGIGAVVLKRTADALADGDTIRAIIRGSALNHDGRANAFSVPNPLAQARVIEEALRRSGLSASSISYIEAHGTGTALGDPVEIAGLTRAFAADPPATGSCAVGSVKSVIGHLEAAAGISAVTKVVLQFKSGQLFPSLHAEELNPGIDFSASPFRIQRKLSDWPRRRSLRDGTWREESRIAGVSSFGAGGANVHMILEEPPTPAPREGTPTVLPILLLSAQNREHLEAVVRRLLKHAEAGGDDLQDLLYTLQTGREFLGERLACVARTYTELRENLGRFLDRRGAPRLWSGVAARKPAPAPLEAMRSLSEKARLRGLDDDELATIARHWVGGGAIEWAASAAGPLRRIPLPTYPFTGKRFWLPGVSEARPKSEVATTSANGFHPPVRLDGPTAGPFPLRPVWRETARGASQKADGTMLVIGAGERLLDELRRLHGRSAVVGVRHAGEFREMSPDSFLVGPDHPEDYRALFSRFGGRGQPHATVVVIVEDLGTTGSAAGSRADGAEEILLSRLYSLVRGWDGARQREGLRLVVASSLTSNRTALAAATGFLRSVRLEKPRIAPCVLWTDDGDPVALATALSHEACSDAFEVRIGAGRRHERLWIPFEARVVGVSVLKPTEASGDQPIVITGGAGGLGLKVARHLADRGWRRLVLVGRTPIHAPGRWSALVDSELAPGVRSRVTAFAAMELAGCEIMYLEADVADEPQLDRALGRARERFGPIVGLIHCAGSSSDSSLDHKAWDSFRAVLAPKISGTVHLDRLTQADPLEFFILFSSVTAVTGNLGQCDYAAGNAFMDEFAAVRAELRARGLRSGRTLSIGWPLWKEGGMRADPDVERALRVRGLTAMESDAGTAMLDAVSSGADPHVLVWSGDARGLQRAIEGLGTTPVASPEAGSNGTTDGGAPIALADFLSAVLAEVIKMNVVDVHPDRDFAEFGVDSIAVREILLRVNRVVGDLLDPFAMAEKNTIRSLAAHLASLGARVPVSPGQASPAPQAGPGAPLAVDRSPVAERGAEPIAGAQAEIAVIGMAGILPGAADLDQFWDNLLKGRSSLREVPPERWATDRYFSPEADTLGKSYSKWGGFIDGLDQFDPEFFGYSEKTATAMDPLHRIFLEVAVRAFEDAGFSREAVGRQVTGVFVGARQGTYAETVGTERLLAVDGGEAWRNNSACMIPGRAAEFFDLRGPACVIDTACSSSLVSVHAACESLRRGECEVALAGGVEALVGPSAFIHFSQSKSLSPLGQCRPFESGADGTVLGEGAGAVVLKPLAAALRDGDHIHAVVRGSAVNNFGADAGASARVDSMKQVMRTCYRSSGVAVSDVGYLELHGEGSLLRDAVELRSIKELWEEQGGEQASDCPVGSVKAQIGHLLLASGIAAFIKACLMLKHGRIPPHLPGSAIARYAGLGATPYHFAAGESRWEEAASGKRRTVGVNASGIAGTNCFVLCSESPRSTPRRALRPMPMNKRRFWLDPGPASPAAGDLLPVDTAPVVRGSTVKMPAPVEAELPSLDRIKARLGAICSGILKQGAIDPDANFFELGMDSFKILQLFHQVAEEFGHEVNPTRLAEFPTLSSLAAHLRASAPAGCTTSGTSNGFAARNGDSHPPAFACAASAGAPRRSAGGGNGAAIEIDFGLYFFANYDHSVEKDRYRLLLDAVKFADANGFSSVFSPERHFEDFGGLYPNPAVINAALAAVTQQIHLRAGSVVSPLHDPIRIAEDWAVVDNLSGGRAGVSFTYGWHCDDFVLFPDRYMSRHAHMFEQIESVRHLWRGGSIKRTNGLGREIDVRTFPRPIQKEIPIWVTCAISRDSFVNAGRIGANIVTFLLGQALGELKDKIAAYRSALAESGFDPAQGRVSLMVHAFLGDDLEEVKEKVREPFLTFIRAQAQLARNLVQSVDPTNNIDDPKTLDALMNIGFNRFFGDSGLMGTLATARESVARFKELGADELSCLIDFGLDHDSVMGSLRLLKELKDGFKPSSKARGMFPDSGARGGLKAVQLAKMGPPAPAAKADGNGAAETPSSFSDRLNAFRSYQPGGANLPGSFGAARGRALSNGGAGNGTNGDHHENGGTPGTGNGYGRHATPAADGDESGPFPLTAVQRAYWMGRNPQFELGATSTHGYVEIKVSLDLVRFEEALQKVIDRHPMLRATVISGREQQVLPGPCRYHVEVVDLTPFGEPERARRLLAAREEESHRIFNPAVWPLFSFKAFVLGPAKQYLTFGFDSLIADASSLTTVFREIMEFYHDPAKVAAPLGFTFREYMRGYEAFRGSPEYARDRAHWLARIPSLPPAPDIPLTKAPSEVRRPRFERKAFTVARARWEQAKALARKHTITPTVLLFTAFAQVLSRHSRHPRFSLNLTVFNRLPLHPEVNRIVGDFTALMVVAAGYSTERSFWENAASMQGVVLESLSHRHFDGVEVIKELGRQRDLLGRAAIPVVFTSNLLNTENGEDGISSMGEVAYVITQTTQAYLDNQVAENRHGLHIAWDFISELFDPEVIGEMFNQYVEIIETLGGKPGSPQAPTPALEIDAWVDAYNRTDDPSIAPATLGRMFSAQVERTPGADAVRFGGECLSYGELDARSNQVAHYLRDRGTGPGSLIGLSSPRALATIVNVLGIIKSGAAYVPIDPEYPEARRRYIVEKTGASIVLDPELCQRICGAGATTPVEPRDGPDDLAYIIFTSGSTGQPKGVMITHGAAANTLIDLNRRFAVGPGDRVLGISSMCFDLSVYDVFGTLSCGACLVLIDDIRNPMNLAKTVRTERITLWNSVPTLFRMFVEATQGDDPAPDLRLALMSGDWIPVTLPAESLRRLPKTRLFSLGGATEASIWSIIFPITRVDPAWTTIPYGYPLANQKFYVLDDELNYCPVGTPGQLFIGGRGLALGYFKDEEKTSAAFFSHRRLGPLYRTGDWGAWRTGGHIEFLGRRDHQVKIRGFRVEIGEIETRLLQHPAVKQVVVLDKIDARGNRSLCAYVVPKTGAPGRK